ncbi:MAG: hypothetical protein CL940_04765 [Deltaproteobacteria bacterium]|nr:hypothetical protein [Deltaproteobacteria bacterium]
MRLQNALICLALPFTLLACSDDSSDPAPATTPDVTAGDTADDTAANDGDTCVPWEGVPVGEPEVVDAGSEACDLGPGVASPVPEVVDMKDCSFSEPLDGTSLLVNSLVLQEPAITFLLDALNPIWKADIESGKLVILFRVVSHDLETGLIEVEAGAGAYTDCNNYSWFATPNSVWLQTDGCNFSTVEPSQIAIFPQTMSKAILISNMTIDGSLDPETGAMSGGNLVGTLREEDIEGLESLDLEILVSELFIASGANPNSDTNCDGESDAWRLSGQISSTPIDNVAF